jgi:hypothetical protein
MESTGIPGRIHVSDAFMRLVPDESWEASGGVQVKGKGVMQVGGWGEGGYLLIVKCLNRRCSWNTHVDQSPVLTCMPLHAAPLLQTYFLDDVADAHMS